MKQAHLRRKVIGQVYAFYMNLKMKYDLGSCRLKMASNMMDRSDACVVGEPVSLPQSLFLTGIGLATVWRVVKVVYFASSYNQTYIPIEIVTYRYLVLQNSIDTIQIYRRLFPNFLNCCKRSSIENRNLNYSHIIIRNFLLTVLCKSFVRVLSLASAAPRACICWGARGWQVLGLRSEEGGRGCLGHLHFRPPGRSAPTFPTAQLSQSYPLSLSQLCYHDIIKRIRELSQHREDISKPSGFFGNN